MAASQGDDEDVSGDGEEVSIMANNQQKAAYKDLI